MAEVIRATSLDDGLPGWVQPEWLDGQTWLLSATDLPASRELKLIHADLAAVASQMGLGVDCRRVRGGVEVRARLDPKSPLQRAKAWLRKQHGGLVSPREIQRALYSVSASQLAPIVDVLKSEGWLTPAPRPRRPQLLRVTAPESAA